MYEILTFTVLGVIVPNGPPDPLGSKSICCVLVREGHDGINVVFGASKFETCVCLFDPTQSYVLFSFGKCVARTPLWKPMASLVETNKWSP